MSDVKYVCARERGREREGGGREREREHWLRRGVTLLDFLNYIMKTLFFCRVLVLVLLVRT